MKVIQNLLIFTFSPLSGVLCATHGFKVGIPVFICVHLALRLNRNVESLLERIK